MTPELAAVIIAGVVAAGNLVMFAIQFRERQQASEHAKQVERLQHLIRRVASVREGADRIYRVVVATGKKGSSEHAAEYGEATSQLLMAIELMNDTTLMDLSNNYQNAVREYQKSLEGTATIDRGLAVENLMKAYVAIGVYCEQMVEQISSTSKP